MEPDQSTMLDEHTSGLGATAHSRQGQAYLWPLLGALLGTVAIILVLYETRQLPLFIESGLEVVPLLVLAGFASFAKRRRWAYWAALSLLGVFMVGLTVTGIALAALASLPDILTKGLGTQGAGGSLGSTTTGNPGDLVTAAWAMPAVALGSLLWLWRPLRVFAARLFAIDPDDFRHTVALVVLSDIVLSALGLLMVLHGKPPLLTLVAMAEKRGTQLTPNASQDLLGPVYQLLWTLPLALIAAGIYSRRTPFQTLRRLSLVAPTWRQVGIGIGLGVLLILAAAGVDQSIAWVWKAMHWPQTDSASFEKLLGAALSPVGAVVIGITAGLGEEVSVRGLLQPRFGIVGANVVFASAHAYQYGPDALLSVFLIGIVLGLIRARWSTTVSALTHGSYDCVEVLATYLKY
jgi:hypothetical protein